MVRKRVARGLFTGGLLLWGGAAPAWAAAPAVADVLKFRPRQEGVAYTTPAPQQEASCKVELVKGEKKGSGWVLRDAAGQTLRRFMDTNEDGRIDVWSYYKDGGEVYRETDSNANLKADQYRWLNAGGMKWGVDANEDGRIDGWKTISAEEASQELLQAVATRDAARLQALLLTDAELKALDLPAAEASRMRELLKQAPARLQATVAKLPGVNDKSRWLQLHAPAPQCVPADAAGARQELKQDLLRHPRATVLCETAGKHEWIQTGEMIQVGDAWRLVEGPAPGPGDEAPAAAGAPAAPSAEVQKLLDDLGALDKTAPVGADSSNAAAVVAYNLKRADLLEQVVAKSAAGERDTWVRQLADCLSAAAQSSPASDKTAQQRLQKLRQAVGGDAGLAAYVSFRELQADYAAKLGAKDANIADVQKHWLEQLAKFVQAYPKADDSADALLQLGMVSEFVGKETEARKWYEILARDFADKPLAAKARGALRRLDLEGKPLELSGPTLAGGTLDVATLRGKVVVVYYWASWNQQCVGDFAKLKLLLDTYGAKGVELVGVNLDTGAEEATGLMKRSPAPGTHLHSAGGLEGKLAADYGIMVLPNLFLVGADGKVVSRSVQMSNLEDELKKLAK